MTSGDGRLTMSSRQDELRALLADAQEQLLARDDVIRSLRSDEFAQRDEALAQQGEALARQREALARQNEAIRWLKDLVAHRDEEIEWLRGVVHKGEQEAGWLRDQLAEQQRSLRDLQSTKLWRLGQRYWRLRDRLRGRSISAP